MPGAVQVLTFEQLGKFLSAQGGRLERLTLERSLKTVALYLASQARRSFDESREPDGTPWHPLQDPSERRGGPTAKPLRDTGLLMASLTGQAAGHVEDISREALRWGTNVEHAGYHQEGTGTIPARPFLGISSEMERAIVRILMEDIRRQMLEG